MLANQTITISPQPTLWFGVDQSRRVAEAVRSTGEHRALVITDEGIRRSGIIDHLADALRNDGCETAIFDDVVANPTTDTLDAGARALREFGRAAVVAVGGGSSLDVAKGVAIAGVNLGSGRDFDYRNQHPVAPRPIVAIPTTAGTGSETNAFGVIDDPVTGEKFYVGHAATLARVAILDPRLHVALPPRVTAATGLDALAHAIECLSSRSHNPYADALALEAARLIIRSLPIAVESGDHLDARSNMAFASHMAGVAFAAGTGLGLGHGIAHAVSAQCGAVHGEVLAVVLPEVMRFNLTVRQSAYARLAGALGVGDSRRSDESNAAAAIDAVAALSERVGVPRRLSGLGCSPDAFSAIATKARRDEVTLNAPRPPTDDDILMILEATR